MCREIVNSDQVVNINLVHLYMIIKMETTVNLMILMAAVYDQKTRVFFPQFNRNITLANNFKIEVFYYNEL